MRHLRWPAIVAACLLTTVCGGTQEATTATPTVTASASPPEAEPAARGYALMAGSLGREVLLLGGFGSPDSGLEHMEDMWAFGGGAWTNLTPSPVPPPGDDFAFDTGTGQAVFVEVSGATWSYDPSANVWEALEVGEGPTGLQGSRMAYDQGSDRMIVFGGNDETWAFDLEAGTWERMRPKQNPPIRTYYAMAYDAAADRVIIFGGAGPTTGEPLADTWAYDYDADVWEQMDPKRSPPARTYAAAAYDSASDRIILYGGSVDGEVAAFEDTWAYDYDADTWTRLAARAAMGELAWHAMAAFPNGAVLFGGGVTRDDYVADTWVFDSVEATWSAA